MALKLLQPLFQKLQRYLSWSSQVEFENLSYTSSSSIKTICLSNVFYSSCIIESWARLAEIITGLRLSGIFSTTNKTYKGMVKN